MPAHKPTKELREKVFSLSFVGYSQKEISRCLELSIPTLEKYYRYELNFARMELLATAGKGLAGALHTKKEWAIKFLLKTQGKDKGWTERNEIVGKDGAPLMPEIDLSKLSDAELTKLVEARRLLASVSPAFALGAGTDEAETSS